MIEMALILLYGLSFIGGAFLAVVWSRVAINAFKQPGPVDQFCMIALGLFLGALGNVVVFGTRTINTIVNGVEKQVIDQAGIVGILIGLLVLATSKIVLMWAHDPSHTSPSWRWFAFISALWVLGAPVWLLWRGFL